MSSKTIFRPAMPLYVADFMDSETVALMPLDAVGAYIKLLCHNWKHGSIPADQKQLAALLRIDPRVFRRIWKHIGPKFRPISGESSPEICERLVNDRVEVERRKADLRAEKSRNAANSLHTGDSQAGPEQVLGGCPRAGASSSSSSSSLSEKQTHARTRVMGDAWNGAGLPINGNAEELRHLAEDLDAVRRESEAAGKPLASDSALCVAFKTLLDAWKQKGIVCRATPAQMRDKLAMVQQVATGELTVEMLSRSRSARGDPAVNPDAATTATILAMQRKIRERYER